jgi:predicted component of type VI protein secretion system
MASQTYQLVMRSGPTPGKVFELTLKEMTIGRDIGNHIVINDPEMSRRHARLVAQAGGYVLEDLGSTNGSFINGQRLMGPHLLRPGEQVMFGENIGLAYEAIVFDADATLVSGAAPSMPPVQETYRVPPQQAAAAPQPSYQQPAYQQPAYQEPAYQQPAYNGQADPYAAEPYYEEPVAPKKNTRMYLMVGCGCLIVLGLCCLVGAIAFDTIDLYCTPPFDALFSCP